MSNQYGTKMKTWTIFWILCCVGREIVIEYHGKQYGIFYLEKGFMWHNLTMMKQEKLYRTRMKHWNTLLTVQAKGHYYSCKCCSKKLLIA